MCPTGVPCESQTVYFVCGELHKARLMVSLNLSKSPASGGLEIETKMNADELLLNSRPWPLHFSSGLRQLLSIKSIDFRM